MVGYYDGGDLMSYGDYILERVEGWREDCGKWNNNCRNCEEEARCQYAIEKLREVLPAVKKAL